MTMDSDDVNGLGHVGFPLYRIKLALQFRLPRRESFSVLVGILLLYILATEGAKQLFYVGPS
jgi:hypothetical protein